MGERAIERFKKIFVVIISRSNRNLTEFYKVKKIGN